MEEGSRSARRPDWLDRAGAAALLAAALAAGWTAVRLGAAAGDGGGDVLAAMRARTAERLERERGQIRPVLEADGRGAAEEALRLAEEAAGGLPENSQLRLFLGEAYRRLGRDAAALAEYRRAFELVRDYSDRCSSSYAGGALRPWLERIRRGLAEPGARGDLHYLLRALAGGCS